MKLDPDDLPPPVPLPPVTFKDRHIALFCFLAVFAVWPHNDAPLVWAIPIALAQWWAFAGLSRSFKELRRRNWEAEHPSAARFLR